MKTRWSLLMVLVLMAALCAASVTRADVPMPEGILEAGGYHNCALTASGAVDCWGRNDSGQANDQAGPYTQVSAGYWHTCALRPSGAVDCWGKNDNGEAEDQIGPYSQVSAGHYHTCALTLTGAADCWGTNNYGESNDQPGPYIYVSAGGSHNCALTASGAVDCWGYNGWGQAEDQPGPYTQLSSGSGQNCALRPSGAVHCWGSNSWGEGADPPGPYTQVSAFYAHTCALTPSGAVDCWGDKSWGQWPAEPGTYAYVSIGNNHSCALTTAGGVNCWGLNWDGQGVDQPGPYGPYIPSGDTTPPVVTVTGVSDGAVYSLGAVPQAGCSTTDAESGVATEATLSLSGGTALGVGSFSATCSGAVDNAGNQAGPVSVNYTVTFQFTGFTAPVDNPDVLNVAKAGQTVPLKWRIVDASGSPVTGLTEVSVTVVALACEQGQNPDPVEEYGEGTSGLQNLGDGYYQWNWKTPKDYAGLCKTFELDLGEGAAHEHLALFQFR